ncbi:hypothetical protein B0A48_01996 [Cryoendolithus antarcticus]|uniref:Bola-like protein n=1 Tax=Cryoendolithus antarcticus TaxID=1507870 RepID=A0A1V8TQZ5_9PEZI|nr:hypothetical protein B0A48_01996 [Cryoendolithus antarcticus]
MTTPVRSLLRVSRALTIAPCRAGPAAPGRAIAYGRLYSTDSSTQGVQPPDFLGEGELKVFNILKNSLHPTKLEVQDVSGGCGSMYALDVVSAEFAGLPIVKQHRLVTKVLGEEIKKWHGVQMKTKAP